MGVLIGNYNSNYFSAIPEMTKALKVFQENKGANLVENLGKVFVKHKMYDKYGVIMVHRHFSMLPDEILVESFDSENKLSIAVPWKIQDGEWLPSDADYWNTFSLKQNKLVFPGTWAFDNNGHLVPFEFIATNEHQDSPSPDFVADFYKELKKVGLEKMVGLRLLQTKLPSFETTPEGVRANVVKYTDFPDDMSNFVKVVWTFDENGKMDGGSWCLVCVGNACNCK